MKNDEHAVFTQPGKPFRRFHTEDPILIVEDTKETQVLLQGICKSMEIACVIAKNGVAALELIEKQRFSIFVVDLMMPVMDGRTFIINLKNRLPEAVVLVETALDSSQTIIDIMKLGVFDYIIKPIDPELFQQTDRKAVEFKNLKDMEKTSLNAGLKIQPDRMA